MMAGSDVARKMCSLLESDAIFSNAARFGSLEAATG